MTRTHPQQGSAFFLILIGIAIFSALSYAVMEGSRVSQAILSKDQAAIAARDIISYGDLLQKAVGKMKLLGCTNDQISFERNNPYNGADYANTNAPVDGSCDVFAASGGKVNGMKGPTGSEWFYTGQGAAEGVGTNCGTASCSDLVAVLPDLPQAVCEQIQQTLYGEITLYQDAATIDLTDRFTGTYLITNGIGTLTAGKMLNKSSGCLSSGSSYFYFQTLIAR